MELPSVELFRKGVLLTGEVSPWVAGGELREKDLERSHFLLVDCKWCESGAPFTETHTHTDNPQLCRGNL